MDLFVPTLLLLCTLTSLGITTDGPTPSAFQRTIGLQKASAALSKNFASRQLRKMLRIKNGPDVSDIPAIPIRATVLVYPLERDKWEGP